MHTWLPWGWQSCGPLLSSLLHAAVSATSPRGRPAALAIGVTLAALALDGCQKSVPVSQRSVVLVTLGEKPPGWRRR